MTLAFLRQEDADIERYSKLRVEEPFYASYPDEKNIYDRHDLNVVDRYLESQGNIIE